MHTVAIAGLRVRYPTVLLAERLRVKHNSSSGEPGLLDGTETATHCIYGGFISVQ